MRTNWPSTLTQQKVRVLFYLTLLTMKQVAAGNAFRNCLKSQASDKNIYNLLLKFPFDTNALINNNAEIELCCDGTKCLECTISNSYFYCRKLFNHIFCHWDSLKCVGTIGNASITENKSEYGANCSISTQYRDKFDLARNIVNTGPIIGLDRGYGFYDCSASDYCLRDFCGWDNGGWMCYSHVDSGPEYCYMQWPAPWPGHAETNPSNTTIPLNPTTTSETSTTETTSTATSTSTPAPTDDHLVEKIAIPIGIVTGTSLTAGLTYYFCKKKKREKQLLTNNSNNQWSFDNLPSWQQSEIANNINQSELTDFSNQAIANNSANSPTSQKSVSDIKEQLIKQLEMELVGHEQLWKNYLDVNNLLTTNPQSELATSEFYRIQNELLKIFTISDLNLLLENEISKQSRNSQTDYFETKENSPQNYSEEARSPQLNSFTMPTEDNRRHPQGEYFEVRDPQGINLDYHY